MERCLQVRWRARCEPGCVWTGRRWRRWPAAFCPDPCCGREYSRIRSCCWSAPPTPPGCRTGNGFHQSEEETEERRRKRREKEMVTEEEVGGWLIQKRNICNFHSMTTTRPNVCFECSSNDTWWGLTALASWSDRKMSFSPAGWFKLTSTLPWASGWLRASLVCAPLGSLSSSFLVDLLLMWMIGSSSPELRSITSARRKGGESNRREQKIIWSSFFFFFYKSKFRKHVLAKGNLQVGKTFKDDLLSLLIETHERLQTSL